MISKDLTSVATADGTGNSAGLVSESPASEPGSDQKGLSKSTVKRFAINVASLFSLHVANMLLPLLTVPYVVRIIGPERLGLLNFSQAFINYFVMLINYGFDMASVRIIAANRHDQAMINRVFSEVLIGKALLWVLSTVIFGSIIYTVPAFEEHYWLHICTYALCIGTVFFPVWLFQAMESLGQVALFNTIIKVLVTLTVFIAIRQPDDYIYQNLSLSVAQIIIGIVAFYVAIKRFNITFSWPDTTLLIKRFRDDSTLFFTSVVATIYAYSNSFLLGIFSTDYSVGIFTAGVRIVSIAQAFVSLALNQAFFPIVANAFGESREKGLTIVRTIFFPVMVLMLLISIGLWVTAPFIISLLYGAKFTDAVTVLRITSLLPLTLGLNNLLGVHTMLSLRMDKAFFRISVAGSIISLGLNTLLIQKFSYIGVACSWVITEVFVCFAFYVYLRYKGIQIISLTHIHEAIQFTKNRLAVLLPHKSWS